MIHRKKAADEQTKVHATADKGKHKFRGISISLKLFAYLAVFTAVALIIIWIFQVILLNKFYMQSKLDELAYAEKEIAACIDDNNADSLNNIVHKYAADYSMGIKVCRIVGSNPVTIASANLLGESLIFNLSKETFYDICKEAIDKDGTYVKSVKLRISGTFGRERKDVSQDTGDSDGTVIPDNANDHVLIRPSDEIISTIYVGIEYDSSGNQYAVVLNSQMTPLSATVNTLQKQFGWITVVLLLTAGVFTYLISRGITRPIIKMNQSAKVLATGNYNVEFTGGGYREVKELADTLNYTSSELAKTDNLQKELIANVSHDLRTPLTMISGYAEVMRDIPGENTPENVQVIIDESKRLSELVNDLLDLSKLRAGTRKVTDEIFDLTATVRDTLTRYDKLMRHDGYRVEFLGDGDVYIKADRTSILQVVYNLINNAINYTGEDKYVCVTQKINGDRVRISVADHGSGIAPEEIPLIWDRYYKVDRVHKRATVGTGLGLSIVKGILEMYGAIYGVESKLGEGSIFWFELPVCDNGDEDIFER